MARIINIEKRRVKKQCRAMVLNSIARFQDEPKRITDKIRKLQDDILHCEEYGALYANSAINFYMQMLAHIQTELCRLGGRLKKYNQKINSIN